MSETKYSKKPMYIMIVFLCVVLAIIWSVMLMSRKPNMIIRGDTRIVYNHSKEEDTGFPYRFSIVVSSKSAQIPSDGVKAYYIKGEDMVAKYPNIQKSDFIPVNMSGTPKGDVFAGSLPSREKNTKYYFFMEVYDSQKNLIATLPEEASTNALHHQFYRVSYKMDPNIPGLVVHILLMMVALIFMLHSFYFAFNYLWNKYDWIVQKSIMSIFWGTVCYFISGFPLGIWIEYEKYGTYWTGFPVGWDMTDSKTFFVFFYWLVVVILVKGTIFCKDKTKDIISYKTYIWLTLIGSVLTMVSRFIIPHGDL